VFAVVVEGMRRACFDAAGVGIGRSTLNDVVLPHPDVSRQHAKIVVEGPERLILVDRNSAHGTWVDGVRIVEHPLRPSDRIQIGPFVIAIERSAAPDLVEQRLIGSITERQDVTSRLVYADWLEEQGQAERAEFLRLQEYLVTSPHDMVAGARLRALAASIELGWRHAVARPVIEGCDQRVNFKCPKEWGSLTPTDRQDVRHCDGCNQHVYYAPTVELARQHVELNRCVAVDIIPLRRRGDLERPASGRLMMGMIPAPGR
jgi:uncharacterized protein (TIGR02996 family)